MFTGSRREHHLKAEASQKVTENLLKPPESNYKPLQKRDGFSEYKKFREGIDLWFLVRFFLLNALYHVKVQTKTREFRLQSGKVIYKVGISLTKKESHLQNGTLGLQTGLSACYLPPVEKTIAKCKTYLTH